MVGTPSAHTAEPLVTFIGVDAGYDRHPVLRDLTFALQPGQFAGIVGPSGAGKTTLLRALLGAVPVRRGHVQVAGRAVGVGAPASIGYVPQLETVDWNFPVTVEQVVQMGCRRGRPWPWPSRDDRHAVDQLLERLGLAAYAGQHIRNLSGGQQQRVFLARALIGNPRLLVLDEPTSGVDVKTRHEILRLLAELNAAGITILLTTHDLNAVAAHLPWLVCLNGRVIAEGPPAEVLTTAVLRRTYGAEMAVLQHQGHLIIVDAGARNDMPRPAVASVGRGR